LGRWQGFGSLKRDLRSLRQALRVRSRPPDELAECCIGFPGIGAGAALNGANAAIDLRAIKHAGRNWRRGPRLNASGNRRPAAGKENR
jgi:hypothetical protein